nr:immunoglobulin heavy chain junction region [Macaca mulatta]MOV38126.1 immunoglobulin heavy chain junction region [Macaca mulatta]MOV38278.1 immunoglobulin heavy chain junction region [Macaca mulatta]MOV38821.1 immunoglobulin heavy chain junction region [Macaca mulatta]MOV38905.1 immunoglobulin heavy chain junction region [Macaca mulatta]
CARPSDHEGFDYW